MMARILLSAQTPLSLRHGREKETVKTLEYIPGTVLWGALASAHTMLRPNQPDEFAEFFLQDRVHFGNLYPSKFDRQKFQELTEDKEPIYPLPRTARSCKRFSGFYFQGEREGEEYHGVFDQLIPWTLFAMDEDKGLSVLNNSRKCPHLDCEHKVDRFEGFYRQGEQRGHLGRPEVKKSIRTRTGLSRLTGATAREILYSRETLAEGGQFWGTITTENDTLFIALSNFAEEAAEKGLLRLGNNRTRSLGRVTIPQFQQYQAETADGLAERASAFDQLLRQTAQQAGIATPHNFYLSVTLISDVIIYDHLLRYQLQLDSDYLAHAWEITGAKLIYQNAGRRQVMGWSNLWGLPKADQGAITMGSVFLFGLVDKPDFEHLLEIQQQGIGARRSEGFGQVRLADSFHMEVKPL